MRRLRVRSRRRPSEEEPGFDAPPASALEVPRAARRDVVTAVGFGAALVVAAVLLVAYLGSLRLPADHGRPALADDPVAPEHGASGPGRPAEVRRERPELLAPGDCFDLPPLRAGDADDVEEVILTSCDVPHDAEVFTLGEVRRRSGAGYPPPVAWSGWISEICDVHFEDYVGIPYERSRLVVHPFVPEPDAWAEGDRTVTCALRQFGIRLDRSMADSGEATSANASAGAQPDRDPWTSVVGAALLLGGARSLVVARRRVVSAEADDLAHPTDQFSSQIVAMVSGAVLLAGGLSGWFTLADLLRG